MTKRKTTNQFPADPIVTAYACNQTHMDSNKNIYYEKSIILILIKFVGWNDGGILRV